MQRVRASGRQPPEPCTDIYAPGALQVIRVRDFHQVGRPPEEILRFDQMVTLNGFHELVTNVRGRKVKQRAQLGLAIPLIIRLSRRGLIASLVVSGLKVPTPGEQKESHVVRH